MAATQADHNMHEVAATHELYDHNTLPNGTEKRCVNTTEKGKYIHNFTHLDNNQFHELNNAMPVMQNKTNNEDTSSKSDDDARHNNYQGDVYNHVENNQMHLANNVEGNNQYGFQNVRHHYPKGVRSQTNQNINSHNNYIPQQVHSPQRIMSGQSISQQMGPTPTLNQLLQSSNPVHRYQNNYPDYGKPPNDTQNSAFNHNWNSRPYLPPQQPTATYRNPSPNVSRNNSPGNGPPPPQTPSNSVPYPPAGSSSVPPGNYPPHPQASASPPQQYPPYPQRYPTPPGGSSGPVRVPAYPPSHHQIGPYGPYPGDGRPPWPPSQQMHPAQPQPPQQPTQIPPVSPLSSSPSTPSSTNAQQHSPQRSLPSPQTVNHPEPSPQHQPQQSPQHQSQMIYGNRRPHSSITPEPGDVTSQNSNDSTSGGPQAMRPTPSPTGSSSSRSMSPAIGQQNLSMPPRPSSGQSDTGSTSSQSRLSQSPMTNQGGYQQQPLAPPPHMHPYKMTHAPPPGSMHSTSIAPATPPGAPNYASQIPQPHQQFPHQGNYMVRPPYQNFPMQQQSNQFPGRPVANHMPQFGNYQSWPGPAMNASPSSVPLSLGGSVSPSSNHVTSPPISGKTVPSPTSSPQQHHQSQPIPTSSANAHQMHMQQHMGPNGSPNMPPANSPSSRSHTPPQYLKQHLQHKVGFNSGLQPASPGGSPMYGRSSPTGMGPPHHHGHQMGPPHHHSQMGMSPSPHDPSMAPPTSSTQLQHMQVEENAVNDPTCMLTTTVNVNATNVSQVNSGTITSVITTGPDGASVDEASQQSTLSNTSAASGDDPSLTPKRKESSSSTSSMNMMMPMGNFLGHTGHSQSHIMPPGSPASSGINSIHDEYSSDVNSPWSRPPTSPVFNSHNMSQDIYRSKKHDSLSKLYEMDDNPERRIWLDKLLQFMEDRGSPISATPTISKNPLDLFRLYLYVKERGGFIEVCKVQCSSTVTKNKIWKDIAGLLGIGASSSAAYTLRKHYTKNLLPFECHFDRGGIDPEPIINQLETSTKKKGPKTASVPSPGSSNSQDSFPSPAPPNMDGYSNYPYPNDFNNQRPPPPHQNSQGLPGQPGGYQGQPGYPQYPPAEQYGQQYHMTPNNYPPSRPAMYPVYPPDAPDRGYSQNNNNPVVPPGGPQAPQMQPNQSDVYARGYNQPNYPVRPPYTNSSTGQTSPPSNAPTQNAQAPPSPTSTTPIPQNYPPSPQHQQPLTPPPAQSQPRTPPPPQQQQQPLPNQQPPPQPVSQDYYKPDQQMYQNQPPPGSAYPGVPTKGMPPPGSQIPQQPRRHPDFAKEQQQQQQQQQQIQPQQPPYPPYNNQQRPVYGWTNGPNNQYRPSYPVNQTNGPQQWPPAQGPPPPQRPPLPPNPQAMPNAQWDQNRYPLNSQSFVPPPPQVSASGQWNVSSQGPTINHNAPVRSPRPNFRPDSKPYPPMSTQGPLVKGGVSSQPLGGNQMVYGSAPSGSLKRELTFPPDSVESVTPVLYKRRKLVRSDVAPVDAWKLMMSLRSGLLSETTWALDVLNILLYDEIGIQYFGLNHLPGLLDILMEHFNKSLSEMLDEDDGEINEESNNNNNINIKKSKKKCKWYERVTEECIEPDLGTVKEIDTSETVKISNLPDFTVKSRRGIPAQYVDASNDLFIKDGKRNWDKKKVTMDDIIAPDTGYIVHCFKSDIGLVPFVRVMKGKAGGGGGGDEKRKSKRVVVKEEKIDEEEDEGMKKEAEVEERNLSKLEEKLQENGCNIRDPFGILKRKNLSDYEDECYTRDEASLYLVTDTQDSIARRCICISTILRNLTFVPGNELEFAKCPSYLALMGKLLQIHHEHPLRAQKQQNYDREEDLDFSDCCSSLQAETEWWWDFLHQIRENVLVSIANIAGYVDFSIYTEEVSRPVLDGLLHWAICPAAQGQDAFPTAYYLSPQRLALEALCKLCVTDANVDLVIATPPYSRLERLTSVLTKLLCRNEEQVLREFAVNLLHYLAAADSIMARLIALQSPCVSLLVAFIEQAEQSALSVANQHGINALRDNPESMGTSLDMLRRAARTLLHLSKHPDNIPLFLQQEQRLLALVMSQILDQQVAAIISQVLYQCSRNPSTRSR